LLGNFGSSKFVYVPNWITFVGDASRTPYKQIMSAPNIPLKESIKMLGSATESHSSKLKIMKVGR
jgi:hypothetical protein